MYEITSGFFARPETKSMLIDSGEMFIQLFIELTFLFLVIS